MKTNSSPVVLHIVYSGLGGLANICFSLVEASKDDNYEHVVAFYGIESLVKDYSEHCDALGIKHRFFHRRPRIDFRVNASLYSWIEEIKPVAIIANVPRALAPAARYQSKFPATSLLGVEHHPNVLKRALDWWDSARFCKYCTDVVYNTQISRQEVKDKLRSRYRPEKSVIIPNGVNVDKFLPACNVLHSTDQTHSTDQSSTVPVRIGMCSRLSETKDIITLIRSMKVIRDAQDRPGVLLTIAGDGPEKENLLGEVDKLQLSDCVVFEGFLGESALISWFQKLDIYAHATLSETMSTSIMQALAIGLPCVVSDLPGMEELVSEQAGYRVPTKNPEKLAAVLLSLLRDERLRCKLGAKAREHAVQNLSHGRSWQSYKTVIESRCDV